MYIVCSRCNFKVPGNKQICHICGNSRLRANSSAVAIQPTNVLDTDQMAHATENLKAQIYQLVQQVKLRFAEMTKRKERKVEATAEHFDFLATYRDTHLSFSAVDQISGEIKNPGIAEFVAQSTNDTATLNAHIEEAVQWFKEYGREGLLTSKGRVEEPLRLSDAA